MVDTVYWQILLMALAGWVNRHQLEAIEYLREENRVLKAQLCGRRLRLTDAQRRRLAGRGHALGRAVLARVATLVTPDTILRWHRQLIARKWTTTRHRVGRPGVLAEIRQLTVRMAESHMGVSADSGRAEEPQSSGRSIHDRWNLARPRHQPGARAADVMADVSRGALGRDCCRRLFHHRSLDCARPRHLLHAVRHRARLTPGASAGIDATSRRRVRRPSRSHADALR